jgi:chromatin segregation and condensation protein Rec8/ScpA/Scc1 (kleisin family)
VTPPPRPQHVTLDLTGVTLEALRAAAQAVFYLCRWSPAAGSHSAPRISITQQISLIRQRLMHGSRSPFTRCSAAKPTRVEAVVTLQAILELINKHMVQATQATLLWGDRHSILGAAG